MCCGQQSNRLVLSRPDVGEYRCAVTSGYQVREVSTVVVKGLVEAIHVCLQAQL